MCAQISWWVRLVNTEVAKRDAEIESNTFIRLHQ
jgi:hypothetical protein